MDLFSPQVPPSDFHPNFRALPYVRNQKLSEKEVLCSVQAAELKFQRLINFAERVAHLLPAKKTFLPTQKPNSLRRSNDQKRPVRNNARSRLLELSSAWLWGA